MTLDELAIKHYTDKSSLCHNYPHIYETVLKDFVNKEVVFLEIGVQNGSSLRAWSEYFINGKIHGIDINPECIKHGSGNISVHIGDIKDQDFLKQTMAKIGTPDIILDDGSHLFEDTKVAFESLFPYVKYGGFYIIEDLYCAYSPSYQNGSELNFVEYLKHRIDDLNWNDKNEIVPCGNNKLRHTSKLEQKTGAMPELNYYEKYIKAMHFYKSVCVIEKDIDWEKK